MSKVVKARCVLQIQLDVEYNVDELAAHHPNKKITTENVVSMARKRFVDGSAREFIEEMLREEGGFGIDIKDGTSSYAKVDQTYGDVWIVPEVVN